MIDIFICEDDKKQREQIETYVQNYVMMEQLDMKIALSTDDPEEIIQFVQNNKVYGLYFLDVHLQHEKSGIVLGAEIRKYDPTGAIVFVTSHSELTYLTFLYKVEALDYIIKDAYTDLQKRIIDCIKTVYDRFKLSQGQHPARQFQVKSGDKIISEDYEQILFFETSAKLHKIIMHTPYRQVEFYGKLKEIESLYSSFYRCHNSHIVNIDNIKHIDKKTREITFSNGAITYASNRYIKGLINKWKKKFTLTL